MTQRLLLASALCHLMFSVLPLFEGFLLTIDHEFAVNDELGLDEFLLAWGTLHKEIFAQASTFWSSLWKSDINRLVGGCEASSLRVR